MFAEGNGCEEWEVEFSVNQQAKRGATTPAWVVSASKTGPYHPSGKKKGSPSR
jgi:hypothetical protein